MTLQRAMMQWKEDGGAPQRLNGAASQMDQLLNLTPRAVAYHMPHSGRPSTCDGPSMHGTGA